MLKRDFNKTLNAPGKTTQDSDLDFEPEPTPTPPPIMQMIQPTLEPKPEPTTTPTVSSTLPPTAPPSEALPKAPLNIHNDEKLAMIIGAVTTVTIGCLVYELLT